MDTAGRGAINPKQARGDALRRHTHQKWVTADPLCPALFARHLEDNLNVTVPHEVAHNMIDCLYRIRKVRPHGAEWKAVMQKFGAVALHLPLRFQRRPSRKSVTTTTAGANRVQQAKDNNLYLIPLPFLAPP